MKKNALLLVVLLLSIINIATGQSTLITTPTQGETITITGSVKSATGDALHFAFLQDKQFKYGTYTDSVGNFILNVNPHSKLHVTCRGFKDTLIDINNQTSFNVVLNYPPPAGSKIPESTGQVRTSAVGAELTDFQAVEPNSGLSQAPGKGPLGLGGGVGAHEPTLSAPIVDAAQGAIFPQFNHKEETVGSRYFFGNWVHGYVINAQDQLIQNPAFLLNYDKMKGDLLLTKDKVAAISVYKDRIKSFTLVDNTNQQYTFAVVPEIDKAHFVQVIADGKNYKIYKTIFTTFIKSNYSTDGVASTGNNYDEYKDEYEYYVLDAKTNQLKKIALKKKAIKEVFAADADKLGKFMNDNSGDIDDSYLGGLGDYMNK